ncbi:hypothetical protein H6F95_28955 [Cyanobacteria bacterium FACHB-471]|nr:hypothetical protein [Cyanobacteria bacterium FACHB-471]
MGRQLNPNVSTRVPPEWKAKIEAIALYLNENDASTVGVVLQDILNRLEALEQQQSY